MNNSHESDSEQVRNTFGTTQHLIDFERLISQLGAGIIKRIIMVNLIIIAAIIIGAVAIIIIFAPRIKRWISGVMLKENGEAIPLFNCSIASRGNGSETSDSGDVYDCVETKGGK